MPRCRSAASWCRTAGRRERPSRGLLARGRLRHEISFLRRQGRPSEDTLSSKRMPESGKVTLTAQLAKRSRTYQAAASGRHARRYRRRRSPTIGPSMETLSPEDRGHRLLACLRTSAERHPTKSVASNWFERYRDGSASRPLWRLPRCSGRCASIVIAPISDRAEFERELAFNRKQNPPAHALPRSEGRGLPPSAQAWSMQPTRPW